MLNMVKSHPYIAIIVGIVLLIILFLVSLKLFSKFNLTRKKAKETKNLKKDLMIWKRIASLARGGSESDDAKAGILQNNIHMIEASFEKLKQTLKADFKTVDDVPWYIALGEPFAGKSTLIDNSMQDMTPTERDEVERDGSQKSALLRFWVGSNGIVADVSGKVFFDRWLEGSGAEWVSIVKNIKKKHKKIPLSGIILTIPADSLIADDEKLTKRKAMLMKAELTRLVNVLGMHIPCHVVITKSDIIPGFRDYFGNIDTNVRKAPLGWQSQKPYYEEKDFSNFWVNFIDSLRNGRNALFLNSDIFYSKSEHGRMDKTTNIFLFAESVNDLSSNIEIYLKTIFGGMRHSSFLPSIVLDGLYFTSTGDSGYTLNKFFAKMQNKKIDDSPIAEEAIEKTGFFVSDLFSKSIFADKGNTTYTSRELIKRNIPHYLAVGSMFVLSLVWFLSTIFNDNRITEDIGRNLSFYNETAYLFADKSMNKAYLISVDANGRPVYNGEDVMPNDQLLYRQSYYITALKDAQAKISAPFGFLISSLIKYGTTNMDYYNRLHLFELIHDRLVLFPLIRTIESVIVKEKDEHFSMEKREVFYSLIHFMSDTGKYSMKEEREKLEIMMKYLFPDMQEEIFRLLVAKNTYYKKNYRSINESLIIPDSYFKAVQAGMEAILKGWKTGDIYSDSEYNSEINIIYAVNTIEEMVGKTLSFQLQDSGYLNTASLAGYNDYWTQIYNNIGKSVATINTALQKIKDNNPDFISNHSDKAFIPMLALSYGKYVNTFLEDFATIERFNDGLVNKSNVVLRNFVDSVEVGIIKENAMTMLENDFNRIQTTITKDVDKLFSNIEVDKTIFSYYNLLFALYNSSYNRPINKIVGNAGMASIIGQYNRNIKNNVEVFNKYAEAVQSEEDLVALLPILQLMNKHTYQYNNIMFIKDMVNNFPTTELNLMVGISSKFGETMNVAMPTTKYVRLAYNTEFNTKAIDEYINPFWSSIFEINSHIEKDEVNYLTTYLSSDESYLNLYNVMDTYTELFIKYWGTYGDNLAPSVFDYNSFHQFISNLQPYVVNNELYNAYLTSSKILGMLQEESLAPSLARDKANYVKIIEDKLKGIDPNYTDICTTLVANWVALPTNALKANDVFKSTSELVIKQKYLALSVDDEKFVNIPWWIKLFERGEYFLKHNAASDAVNSIKQYQGEFNKFPLYADGDASRSLEMTDLFNLKYILNDFGWVADNGTSSEIMSIQAPLNLSGLVRDEEQVKKWGKDTLVIINTISSTPIPLEWTLFVPDEVKQIEMARNTGMNTALPLFRYIEFSTNNDVKIYDRFYASADADASKDDRVEIATDDATAGNFKFRFYSHSEDVDALSQVSINGRWSILKLYLDDNTVKESDTVYYLPVYVIDERDIAYIYYLGVEFNKPMPSKRAWPNRYNWPDFS